MDGSWQQEPCKAWAALGAPPQPHAVLVPSPHARGICSSLHLSSSLPAVPGRMMPSCRQCWKINIKYARFYFIYLFAFIFLREVKKNLSLVCLSLMRDFKVIFHQLSLPPQEKNLPLLHSYFRQLKHEMGNLICSGE